MSPAQLKYIHQARKQAGIVADETWRLLLWNTARVNSSKDLDNAGFEKVMAVLEEAGFRDRSKPGDFWRTKAASQGQFVTVPAARKIVRMAEGSRYPLAQMCDSVSKGRTCTVEKLTPAEGFKLIERLKSELAREAVRVPSGDYQRPKVDCDLFSNRKPAQAAEARAPAKIERAAVPCACDGEEPPF
jgi:hypothetical protein